MASNKTQNGLENHVSGQANKPLTRPPHALAFRDVIQQLRTNPDEGLTHTEAEQRLQEYGPNKIGEAKGVQPWKIFLRQIANSMTMVLIMAMAVSFAIKAYIEGGVVTLVILANIGLGYREEHKAAKTMQSLKNLSSPTACVVRDGKAEHVPAEKAVPGDLIELKTGDKVPADIRIIEAMNFETNEAELTGESTNVTKDAASTFDDKIGVGDRSNVAFSASQVENGRATGIVFATGPYTEAGRIAAMVTKKKTVRKEPKVNELGESTFLHHVEAWIKTGIKVIGLFLGVTDGTPLQIKLARLALLLLGVAIACAIIVLAANGFSSDQEVIIYAVATGLSMIPASLIVILTVAMSRGTNAMSKRNVTVRNLRSIEALGGVTDICSDKTGTLTKGKMFARKAWIPARGTYSVDFEGDESDPTQGKMSFDPKPPRELVAIAETNTPTYQTAEELLRDDALLEGYVRVGALANLAMVHQHERQWHTRGDPTEVAIQVFTTRLNWNRHDLTSSDNPQWTLLEELPFSSDVKKMSAIFRDNISTERFVFTKGAVERVLSSCVSVVLQVGQPQVELTEEIRNDILENMNALAGTGLRVLALASKPLAEGETLPTKQTGSSQPGQEKQKQQLDRDLIESDLTFHGLIGLYDPPRPESGPSVRKCHNAGITVHMLTGDHPGTARAIAEEVGIVPERLHRFGKEVADAMVMTASQFDAMTDAQIDQLKLLPLVIARCAPSTKVKMIEALHRRGKFVAMTGDGVNDAPSLMQSDIGIAMGLNGSDVAKDASDITLTDDNFASILNAVEEGRRIFDNIQKFILHLLAQNVALACTLLIGLIFKDTRGLSVFPVSPVQIMFIIMLTSSAPDVGLSFEVAAPDILRRPPHDRKAGVFTREVMLDMVVYGLWVAALVLAPFVLVLYAFGDGELGHNCNDAYTILRDGTPICDTVFRARATCFACLAWLSLFLAWEMVNLRRSFFNMRDPPPRPDGRPPSFLRKYTQWTRDIWTNKVLFWSVMGGFVLVIPFIYIPGMNRAAFRHNPITWEWIIVFTDAALFFLGVEAWKYGKRVFFRRRAARLRKEQGLTAAATTAGGGDGGNADVEAGFNDAVEMQAFALFLEAHPSFEKRNTGLSMAARSSSSSRR